MDGDLRRWIPRLLSVWRRRRRRHCALENRKAQLWPDELREVVLGVKRLSRGLTGERVLAGTRYMDDAQLLGAYLLFYWPVSYAQARMALAQLPRRPGVAMDVGAGPGAMAFAALDAEASSMLAVDRSTAALALARELAAEAGEPFSIREWTPQNELPGGRFDLIMTGHLLNELYGNDVRRRAALVEKWLERLTSQGTLLIVEPALRETSRALLQLRDILVGRGYAVRAPCLFQGPCPALKKSTDWCHAEHPWQLPPMLQSIASAAGLHKQALKMSYLALATRAAPWIEAPHGAVFRIVSEALQGKGRRRFIACGPSGRMGLALLKKHRTAGNELFFTLQRGDVIRVMATEARGDGLALHAASTVELIAHAGQPVPARLHGAFGIGPK